uniref:Uncharacterized protein n=1 Tax=Zea mays TaxID=4577 RepID=A0A804PHJ2_MAIZE
MNLTGGRCAECLAPVNGGSAGHRREISCIPAPNRAGRGNHTHQRASKKSPRLLAEAEATARALVQGGGGPSVINAATMELDKKFSHSVVRSNSGREQFGAFVEQFNRGVALRQKGSASGFQLHGLNMEPGTRLSTSSLPTTGSFCAQPKPKPKDMSSSDAKPGSTTRQSAIARRRKRH